MSFSLKVKNEVCKHVEVNKQEAIAELSAIMKVSGTLLFTNKQFNFKITTENAAIARLVFKILKEHFGIHTEIMIKKNNSLKKNNIYIILISEEEGVKSLLKEVGIIKETINVFSLDYNIPKSIIECDECRRAYIRGAFLGGGSISNPEKTYHLEFVTHNEEYAKDLSNLINSYNLNSKVIKRKNSYIIYLKEGEQIVDLLNIIGAHASLLELENVRIMKEMRNNVNRLVNCETANLSKTVNAAVRQVESIKFIEREIGLGRLPKNLRDVAELRIKYPDESLRELGKMLNPPVGKSGVNHRLRRIEKIADELKQGI
ncbi:DNA-binding protein WhiA [Clostridium botulinum]|uniref:Probable cell division protein WhiA n=10 Tax=Clostridium botulinum TaxID=1491 RepID=WHIA_CLOBH|nr:DNA-binding protein WhiA [Clostridium botulinum]A5I7A0.1 RecName: Full=Probable cell division protein WhiA [Clostridium botulinum A str. Hall]A7FYW9.1 RecName: Full=Probable cell division protein WhiA [Clostridium botulinum A str. ATCC 19397]A7GIX1.1 RecName: Full=Probable cell division protein WhiA [Clostridium botulinum F str. Langeland]B1IFW1.1 RecName: Full=Probable cell division protein WhiA [Clostridium botulinum B1 str. Okra]B1L268.1 RecName: Full=Probable cell division protein WhiA 